MQFILQERCKLRQAHAPFYYGGRNQPDDECDAGASRAHDQNRRHRAGNSMPLKKIGGRRQHGADYERRHDREKKRLGDVENGEDAEQQSDAHRTGRLMTQARENRRLRPRVTTALVFAGAFLSAPAILSNQANAQFLGYAPAQRSSFPADNLMADEGVLPERLRRATVALDTREAPGTIVIDTGNTVLYYVLGQSRAIRY